MTMKMMTVAWKDTIVHVTCLLLDLGLREWLEWVKWVFSKLLVHLNSEVTLALLLSLKSVELASYPSHPSEWWPMGQIHLPQIIPFPAFPCYILSEVVTSPIFNHHLSLVVTTLKHCWRTRENSLRNLRTSAAVRLPVCFRRWGRWPRSPSV